MPSDEAGAPALSILTQIPNLSKHLPEALRLTMRFIG